MPEAIKGAKLKNTGESLTKREPSRHSMEKQKIVTYLSTNCDPSQTRVVQRRQKDRTLKDVSAPSVSELYNKYMFGIDLSDQKRMQ